MDLGLKGKRALLTGSTVGIGFATARVLAGEGAQVTLNGRTEARVASAVQRLQRAVPEATVVGIAADLSGGEGCRTLIDRLPDIDVLVNNMGIFEPKPFEKISDQDWIRVRQNQRKFLAAIAGHQITGPQAGFEDAGDTRQHLIAGWVPVGVVDLLEVVDIDHDQ